MHKAIHTSIHALALTLLVTLPVGAADSSLQEREIEQLLSFVGSSGCDFIRNGKRHEPAEAEAHLRMKYGKARRHIDDAQDFIDRIASKSSWSGKPYQVECPQQPARNSGAWLTSALHGIRAGKLPESEQ